MKYAPYSFSKIGTFRFCQKKFEYMYIRKLEVDDTYIDPHFFKRGKFIHSYIANRLSGGDGSINGYKDVLIDDKLNLIDNAEKLLEHDFFDLIFSFDETSVERCIKLNDNLNHTNKSGHAVIGYIDFYAIHNNIAVIVDWKSGKYKEHPSFDQLKLYALWVLSKYPKVTEIDLVFAYIEHDKLAHITVSRNELIGLKNDLVNQINIIENTDNFKVSPNKYCTECQYYKTCVIENDILASS